MKESGKEVTTLRYFIGDKEYYEKLHVSEEEYWESKRDGDHLMFQEKVGKETLTIRMPLGSWDIMDALVPKILKYNPADIVEIGMGESTQVFAQHAQEYGVKLFSCDIKMGGMFRVFDKQLFPNHVCYIGKSEDFIRQYRGRPAIVFLDGEHKAETVRKEVEFFLPILLPEGVMFLHDTMPQHERQTEVDEKGWSPGDVYLVRQELERNPDVDVFTWPYSAHGMGLTMIMKHPEDRPYWRMNGRNAL